MTDEVHPPALIVIGAPYGSGKTAIAAQLSRDLHIPRLDPDIMGRAIKGSNDFQGTHSDAYRLVYPVFWRLAEDFLRSGVSIILDTTMGWEVSWQAVDALRECRADLVFVPIILRCPHDTCIARISQRHRDDPPTYAGPELFDNASTVWTFLDTLDRPDVHSIDANLPHDAVYRAVREHVASRVLGSTSSSL